MAINFSDDKRTTIVDKTPATLLPSAINREDDRSGIPGSEDVAGIELRMLPPYIRNNNTIRFWPFPGYAKLYCLTMVISDVANQLTGLMDLNAFQRINDGEYLPLNKTIFYWEQDKPESAAPNQVHVMSSVIKSKEALRETGSILDGVKDDNEYQDLVGKLSTLVADTASFNLVTNISMQLARIVGRYMGRVDDKPIGTAVNSFTRLHGDWDKLGITPVHISTRNVDFSYELIIRDKERLALETQHQFLPEEDQVRKVNLNGMLLL